MVLKDCKSNARCHQIVVLNYYHYNGNVQPMSKLAESHSEMEFYFIHFGPIRSCGGSHLDPVIKDIAGFHS